VLVIYSIATGFAILGSAIVFVRTRYAVAIYLVVFGSIIVAAYKMGMVHERPRIVKAGGLDEDDTMQPMNEVDASTVLEVQDPRQAQRAEQQHTSIK
jgi:hypothetical protein